MAVLAGRDESLEDINIHLKSISEKAMKTFKGMHVVPNYATSKLLCEYRGKQVKVEVNQTKRGLVGGDALMTPLSNKNARQWTFFEFSAQKLLDSGLSLVFPLKNC